MKNFKKISILGSTGSIGTQTLDILRSKKNQYFVNYLTVNKNIDLLEQQCNEFNPLGVVINNLEAYKNFKANTKFKGEILFGEKELINISKFPENDLLVSSLVGFAGVEPTLAAIESGIDIALANKETLVSAGNLITKKAKDHNVNIIAVDSEHSAILQCLSGEHSNDIEKLILTASGGPFRELPATEFKNISLQDALNHPNWDMGSKITIDSATMMNKGLELIEAYWLFDIAPSQLEVIVHKESIIHSMVQFKDGSIKAQLGLPDMRIPISYALSYPRHYDYNFPRLDLTEIGKLHFEKPDLDKFKCLKLAIDILHSNPGLGVVLNAANEVAVYNFLNKKISFNQIPILIEKALNNFNDCQSEDLESIIEANKESRIFTKSLIS